MSGSTKILTMMNEKMDIKQIQDVLKTFSKETMKAEMQQDMVRIKEVVLNNLGKRCHGNGNGQCRRVS